MSSKRKGHSDGEEEEEEDEGEWRKMFTGEGELNKTEREIAWKAELARLDDEEADDSMRIDWVFIEQHATEELRDVMESKRVHNQWKTHKKGLLIRSSKSEYFVCYRRHIRKALEEGFRPREYEELKRSGRGKKQKMKQSKVEHQEEVMRCSRPALEKGNKVKAAWFDKRGIAAGMMGK